MRIRNNHVIGISVCYEDRHKMYYMFVIATVKKRKREVCVPLCIYERKISVPSEEE